MAHIIVIDDDKTLLQLIKNTLEKEHSVTVYTGLSGVSIREINAHDLMILDVMMPKINGYKISRLLKYDNKYKDIPIIMVTARSQEDDKIIGQETGVNEYITKPFELDEVIAKVKEYL